MNTRYDMVYCFAVRAAGAEKHEILQLRRAPRDFMGGTWQTVVGRIEAGEKAYHAAARELREETGLVALPGEFYQLDTINTFYLGADDSIWHCPAFCAMVDPAAKIVLNEEHDAFRWIAPSQIESSFMWPGERAQLAEVCREILADGPSKPYLRIKLQ
jgi:dATP pyrophosphohydrolase